jgi:Ca2+-binding EF-hand superfamily protein
LFDKDGSGFLSAKEIKEILSFGGNLSDKVIENVIKEADENEDGEISYDEFV